MPIHECEKCGRIFIRITKDIKFISGYRISTGDDDVEKCPHCGAVQEHGTLAYPVQEVNMDWDFDGFDVGEAAYHNDEELKQTGEDLTPEDLWQEEFDNMDREEVIA